MDQKRPILLRILLYLYGEFWAWFVQNSWVKAGYRGPLGGGPKEYSPLLVFPISIFGSRFFSYEVVKSSNNFLRDKAMTKTLSLWESLNTLIIDVVMCCLLSSSTVIGEIRYSI